MFGAQCGPTSLIEVFPSHDGQLYAASNLPAALEVAKKSLRSIVFNLISARSYLIFSSIKLDSRDSFILLVS